VLAHALSAQAMRSTRSDLLIGPVLNQANFIVDDHNDSNQVHAANMLDAIQNRFWMDAFFNGKYPEIIMDQFAEELQPAIEDGDLELAKVKSDFLGINYYFDNRVGSPIDRQNPWHTLSSHYGLNIDETPKGELTDMGWPLNPEGLGNLCLRWHKEFGDRLPPVFITENGVAYDDDDIAQCISSCLCDHFSGLNPNDRIVVSVSKGCIHIYRYAIFCFHLFGGLFSEVRFRAVAAFGFRICCVHLLQCPVRAFQNRFCGASEIEQGFVAFAGQQN
jgi:hypothetical protein